jgi:large subunit ribosomal protein L28
VECANGGRTSGRWCRLTGKTANNGFSVSHSHIRTHKRQEVNLKKKRIFWEKGDRWVTLRVSTKALRTVEKIGLDAAAEKAGLDLWALPHQLADTSGARARWKAENPLVRNTKKQPRQMKNLVKLAESDHPLAVEAQELLEKARPGLKSGEFPQEYLHLGKLSASDHALAGEGRALLERFSKLGQHLAEERRLAKVQEEYGFLAPSKLMLQVDEENKARELEELAAQESE